jgi:hypothetical protein
VGALVGFAVGVGVGLAVGEELGVCETDSAALSCAEAKAASLADGLGDSTTAARFSMGPAHSRPAAAVPTATTPAIRRQPKAVVRLKCKRTFLGLVR